MDDLHYKEVYFHSYCNTCKHKNVNASPYDGKVIDSVEEDTVKCADNVCDDCLSEPCRVNSHKPVRYEPA